MISRLLPPNRTPLESALADAMSLTTDPGVIRTLADSARCPAALLPWLAWAKSVDGWDEAVTEPARRALIRQSFAIHKRKGTVGAVRRALGALGVAVDFREWHDIPGAAPHTFGLVAWVNDNPADENAVLTPQLYQRLKRLVDDTRNERSHYSFQVGVRFDQSGRLANAGKAAAVGRWSGDAQAVQPAITVHPLRVASTQQVHGVARVTAEPKAVQPVPAVQPLRATNAQLAQVVARYSVAPQPVQPSPEINPVRLACVARPLSLLRVSMEV